MSKNYRFDKPEGLHFNGFTKKHNRAMRGSKQKLLCIFFFHPTAILFCIFQIFVTSLFGQVYNYLPINHYDIETNPSILASPNMSNRIQIIHQNSFNTTNPFSLNSLRLSKYFESAFLGFGLSLNNTNMDSNISYNHIGLGVGYRNVLFNKMYLKLGANYKLVSTKIHSGNFDYFSFNSSNQFPKRSIDNNANLSLTFSSSADDRYYVSFGLLNNNLPLGNFNDSIQFPYYSVINVGNLMNLFDRTNSEISYTGFGKLSKTSNKKTYSHYINFKFNQPISRKSSIQYGSRIGFAENDYFHFIPFVAYYTRKFVVNASYNFHLDKINFKSKYYSTNQFSIIYIL